MATLDVRINANTEGFDSKVNAAKRSLDGLNATAQEFSKVQNTSSKLVGDFSRLVDVLGVGGGPIKELTDTFNRFAVVQNVVGDAVSRTSNTIASNTTKAATAASRFSSVLALVGGPVGAGVLAASALAAFGVAAYESSKRAEEAAKKNDKLAESLNKVTRASLAEQIYGLEKQNKVYSDALAKVGAGDARGSVLQTLIDANSKRMAQLKAQIKEIAAEEQHLADLASSKGENTKGAKSRSAEEELQRTIEAQKEVADAIAKTIGALNEENVQLTRSARGHFEYQLSIAGVDDATRKAALAIYDENEEIKRGNKLYEEHKRINEDVAKEKAKLAEQIEKDRIDSIIEENRRINDDARRQVDSFQNALANGMQTAFANVFYDIEKDGIGSFKNIFKYAGDFYMQFAAQLTANSVMKALIPGSVGAGVATVNPLAAGGLLLGGVLLSKFFTSSGKSGDDAKDREEARRQQQEFAKAQREFNQSFLATLRLATGITSELRENLISLASDVSNAYADSGAAKTMTEVLTAENQLFAKMRERYKFEAGIVESLAQGFAALRGDAITAQKTVNADILRITGRPDYRDIRDIGASIRQTQNNSLANPVNSAQVYLDRYFQARNTENEANKELQVRGILRGSHYGDPSLTDRSRNAFNYYVKTSSLQGLTAEQVQARATSASSFAARSLEQWRTEMELAQKTAKNQIESLQDLRAETIRYYEAQKQLAELMIGAAAALRDTSKELRRSWMTPINRQADQLSEYRNLIALASSSTGEDAVKYATRAASLGRDIIGNFDTTGGANASIFNEITSGLDSVASILENGAPVDYAEKSVEALRVINSALGTMSGQLGDIEDAIREVNKSQQDQLKAAVDSIYTWTSKPITVSAPDVTVHIDGKQVTATVVSTVNQQTTNGETVFAPPINVSSWRTQTMGVLRGGNL